MGPAGRFSDLACRIGTRDVFGSHTGTERSVLGVVGRCGHRFLHGLVDSSDTTTGLHPTHGSQGGYGATGKLAHGGLGGWPVYCVETNAVWQFPKDLSPLLLGRQQPEAQEAKTEQRSFVGQDSVVVFADSRFGVCPDRIVLFRPGYPTELLRVRINRRRWTTRQNQTDHRCYCEELQGGAFILNRSFEPIDFDSEIFSESFLRQE